MERARGRLSPSMLNANSSPNLYLPEISRTRQTVRTLRHVNVRCTYLILSLSSFSSSLEVLVYDDRMEHAETARM